MYPKDVVPNGGATEINVKVGIGAGHAHETILFDMGFRRRSGA